MSSGQILGGVVGGTIGFFTGNPFLGAQIGMMVGGYVDPPDMGKSHGPRLSDLSSQTSSYGGNIPKIYGRFATMGNLFWLKGNKLDEVVVKTKSGGSKGQPSSTQIDYYYYGTFAISLCDNEIQGISRIWMNGQLYYDATSEDVNTIYSTGKTNTYFDVYTGASGQTAAPEIEADVGSGLAPAYPGMAYILFKDLPLARFGNRLPQVKVEVVESATFLTEQKLADVAHGLDFRGTGNAGLGIPHIYRVNAAAIEASTLFTGGPSPSFKNYIFDLNGNFVYVDKMITADAALSLADFWYPNESFNNDVLVVGGLSDSEVLCIKTSFDSGAEQGEFTFSGDYPIYTTTYEAVDDWEPQSDKIDPYYITGIPASDWLRMITISTDGKYIFVATAPNYSGAEIYTYYVCSTTSRSVVYSSTSSSTLNISSFSQNDIGGTDAGVISDDGKYLWVKTGNAEVTVYDLYDQMSVHATFNLDNSISVPQSTIGEIGGTCFLVTKEVVGVFTINDKITSDRKNVSEIISDQCTSSNLIESSDIDVTSVTDDTIGYRATGGNSRRKNLEPLQGAYSFDVIQSGYTIKFKSKNSASAKTIPHTDLMLMGDHALKHDRVKDIALPQGVNINYFDQNRNFDTNGQLVTRNDTQSTSVTSYEMPLCLTDDEAAQIAEKMLMYFWVERDSYQFALPATYRDLEAGDAVTLTGFGRNKLMRLTSVDYSGLDVVCKAVGYSDRIFSSDAVGGVSQTDDTVPVSITKSIVEFLDIPIVTFIGNEVGMHFAAFGIESTWTGCDVQYSTDGGYTFTPLQSFGASDFSNAGFVTGEYTTGYKDTLSIDRETVLNVQLASGQLYNVTEEQMLNGANYAVWGIDGRWEVIKFQRAELQSDGTYNVYNLCRGRSGTEWATGLHELHDKFIVYNSGDTLFKGLESDLLNDTFIIKYLTQGASDEQATIRNYTYNGVNLTPLSPVWPTGSRDGSGNLTIGWTRRTRVGGKWKNSRGASLGEGTESYEIDIYNGSSVVRTLTASTNEVEYTAAQQTTDFGSTQSSVACKIYQLSPDVGRGRELEANL